MVSRLTDTCHEMQERVGESARHLSRTADDYVHENPWRMMMAVGIAGLLVGLLLGSSNRRR